MRRFSRTAALALLLVAAVVTRVSAFEPGGEGGGFSLAYLATQFLPLTGGTVSGNVRIDGTLDQRGAISNGGSATCFTGVTGVPCFAEGIAFSGAVSSFISMRADSTTTATGVDFYGSDNTVRHYIRYYGSGAAAGLANRLAIAGAAGGGPIVLGNISSDVAAGTNTVEVRDGSLGGNLLASVDGAGTGTFSGNIVSVGQSGWAAITPTALSGSVDNYTGCAQSGILRGFCRLDGGASSRDITGIVPGITVTYSSLLTLCATGANNLVLKHENASSTAAYRFSFNGSTDRTILAGACFPLVYDVSSARWRAANGT